MGTASWVQLSSKLSREYSLDCGHVGCAAYLAGQGEQNKETSGEVRCPSRPGKTGSSAGWHASTSIDVSTTAIA